MSLRFSKSVTFHDYNVEDYEDGDDEKEKKGQLNLQLAVVDTAINRILKRASNGTIPSGYSIFVYSTYISFFLISFLHIR